jgi:hypothetical protein
MEILNERDQNENTFLFKFVRHSWDFRCLKDYIPNFADFLKLKNKFGNNFLGKGSYNNN